jgi:hypothetical protein
VICNKLDLKRKWVDWRHLDQSREKCEVLVDLEEVFGVGKR